MRYRESKEQSAEWLRLASARMSQYPAAPNPATFAVWYEHLSGMNGPLSDALNALLESTARLDTAAMAKLHHTFIAGPAADDFIGLGGDGESPDFLTDPLTKLRNKQGVDEAMARALSTPADAGCLHCLVLLDIDHFKVLNDTYGTECGDATLAAVARVISESSQDAGVTCGRYSADRFAILLESTTLARARSITSTACGSVKALKVRQSTSDAFLPPVTVSGGIARMKHGDNGRTFMNTAEQALNHSKKSGRNRTTIA